MGQNWRQQEFEQREDRRHTHKVEVVLCAGHHRSSCTIYQPHTQLHTTLQTTHSKHTTDLNGVVQFASDELTLIHARLSLSQAALQAAQLGLFTCVCVWTWGVWVCVAGKQTGGSVKAGAVRPHSV